MKPIQLLLLPLLAALVLTYLARFRSRLSDRLLILALGLVGVVFVVQPDWANTAAAWVGVGRGADLVTYFALMAFAFAWVMLYARLRRLEGDLTRLARFLALQEAAQRMPVSEAKEPPPPNRPA